VKSIAGYANGERSRALERLRFLLAEATVITTQTAQVVGQSRELREEARQHRDGLRVLRERHEALVAESRRVIERMC
jgi:hypothetical protein